MKERQEKKNALHNKEKEKEPINDSRCPQCRAQHAEAKPANHRNKKPIRS